jgi:hypothetical protein
VCPARATPAGSLQCLSHQVPQKATFCFGPLGAVEIFVLVSALRCADWIVLANQSGVLWILDNKSLAAERVLIQLPLGHANTADAHSLTEYETLGDDQLLLVDGYDQGAVLFPWLIAFADHLADGLVLDYHLFAIGIDLQTAGNFVDFGAYLNVTQIAQILVCDQLLLAQLERVRGLRGRRIELGFTLGWFGSIGLRPLMFGHLFTSNTTAPAVRDPVNLELPPVTTVDG